MTNSNVKSFKQSELAVLRYILDVVQSNLRHTELDDLLQYVDNGNILLGFTEAEYKALLSVIDKCAH